MEKWARQFSITEADQKLFKVAAAGLHVSLSDTGVVYIIRHLAVEQELYRSCTAPLVSRNGLMAAMVFEWAHRTIVHIPHFGSVAHHPAAMTKNQIINCNMVVYFPCGNERSQSRSGINPSVKKMGFWD